MGSEFTVGRSGLARSVLGQGARAGLPRTGTVLLRLDRASHPTTRTAQAPAQPLASLGHSSRYWVAQSATMPRRRLSFARHPSTAPGPPPRFVQQHEKLKEALDWFRAQLNFYRVHLLFFSITPCVVAAIFYASNGQTHIAYIDALFMASSAPKSRAVGSSHRG